jgi:hypothetical protein
LRQDGWKQTSRISTKKILNSSSPNAINSSTVSVAM